MKDCWNSISRSRETPHLDCPLHWHLLPMLRQLSLGHSAQPPSLILSLLNCSCSAIEGSWGRRNQCAMLSWPMMSLYWLSLPLYYSA